MAAILLSFLPPLSSLPVQAGSRPLARASPRTSGVPYTRPADHAAVLPTASALPAPALAPSVAPAFPAPPVDAVASVDAVSSSPPALRVAQSLAELAAAFFPQRAQALPAPAAFARAFPLRSHQRLPVYQPTQRLPLSAASLTHGVPSLDAASRTLVLVDGGKAKLRRLDDSGDAAQEPFQLLSPGPDRRLLAAHYDSASRRFYTVEALAREQWWEHFNESYELVVRAIGPDGRVQEKPLQSVPHPDIRTAPTQIVADPKRGSLLLANGDHIEIWPLNDSVLGAGPRRRLIDTGPLSFSLDAESGLLVVSDGWEIHLHRPEASGDIDPRPYHSFLQKSQDPIVLPSIDGASGLVTLAHASGRVTAARLSAEGHVKVGSPWLTIAGQPAVLSGQGRSPGAVYDARSLSLLQVSPTKDELLRLPVPEWTRQGGLLAALPSADSQPRASDLPVEDGFMSLAGRWASAALARARAFEPRLADPMPTPAQLAKLRPNENDPWRKGDFVRARIDEKVLRSWDETAKSDPDLASMIYDGHGGSEWYKYFSLTGARAEAEPVAKIARLLRKKWIAEISLPSGLIAQMSQRLADGWHRNPVPRSASSASDLPVDDDFLALAARRACASFGLSCGYEYDRMDLPDRNWRDYRQEFFNRPAFIVAAPASPRARPFAPRRAQKKAQEAASGSDLPLEDDLAALLKAWALPGAAGL